MIQAQISSDISDTDTGVSVWQTSSAKDRQVAYRQSIQLTIKSHLYGSPTENIGPQPSSSYSLLSLISHLTSVMKTN